MDLLNSGSFSGIGPQPTGLLSPTPAELGFAASRQAASMSLHTAKMLNDPVFRSTTGLLATGLAGDPATAQKLLHNTATGQMMKDATAFAMHAGLLPGGSPVNMSYATQQMMATQGFRVGSNVANLRGSIFGAGAITDQMSSRMYDTIRDNFYDRVTGLGKSNAYGMDKTQMGEAITALSNRGAFRGMQGMSVNHFADAASVQRERAKAVLEGGQEAYIRDLDGIKDGGLAVKMDKLQGKKITDIFGDYIATLKDAKEIFGNLPIGELTQNAERLIGAGVHEMGSTSMMRTRMASLRATSKAFGGAVSAQALAEASINLSDAASQSMAGKYGGNASDYTKLTAAGANSAVINSVHGRAASEENANIAKGRGAYVRTATEAQIQADNIADVASLAGERDTGMNVTTAAMALISTGDLTGSAKMEALRLMGSLGTAGTAPQIQNITSQLQGVIGRSGINLGEYQRNNTIGEMIAKMSPAYAKQHADMLQANAQARGVNTLTKMSREGTAAGLMGTEAARNGMMTVMGALNPVTREAAFSAVNPDGTIDNAKLAALYATNPGISDVISQSNLAAALHSASAANKPGVNAGNSLRHVADAFANNSNNIGAVDRMTKMEAMKVSAAAWISDNSLGGPMSTEGIATEAMRGFFGSNVISDNIAMQYLENNGGAGINRFKLNADNNALAIDTAGAGKLFKALGPKGSELMQALGLKDGDHAGLAKALSKSSGFNMLSQYMGDSMVSFGNGNFNMVDAATAENAKKHLSGVAEIEHAKKLLGVSDMSKVNQLNLTTPEGQAEYGKLMREGLRGDEGNKRLMTLVDDATKNSFQGADFDALANEYKRAPFIKKILTQQAEEAREEFKKGGYKKGSEAEARAIKLENIKNRLEGAAAPGKFLGVMQLTGDILTANIFQSQ